MGVYSSIGDFTHTAGGTFNHNSGTVVFTSSTCGANTVDVATSEIFYNLTLAQSCFGMSIAAGDTLITQGTFTQDGPVTVGAIDARGNVLIGVNSGGGMMMLAFTGSSDQTYTDQGGNEPDGDITINKTEGAVILASNADWNGTNQELTITSGLLIVPQSYNLATDALTVGASGKLRISGTGDLTLGGTLTNSGEVSIRSTTCGQDDLVLIRSSVNGTQRSWNGAGTFTLYDVNVQDMAGSATITAYSSTNTGNNGANPHSHLNPNTC